MTLALAQRLKQEPTSNEIFNEMLEWMILNWKAEFIIGFIQHEAGLHEGQVTRLIQLFSLDYRHGAPERRHAGDGFFPPLVQLTNSILISPDMVRLFLQTRNILYGLQRTDPKLFDEVISQDLEPRLLEAAVRALAPMSDLTVRTNISWEQGEIDLLVFDASTNSSAHVQAKAPLGPHGARLVDRLEGRLVEGLDQVRRFKALPREQVDRILSGAIGTQVRNVEVTDMILARSCFGTEKVRQSALSVELVSLPLLARAVEDCVNAGSKTLPAIIDRCRGMRRDIVQRSNAYTDLETLVVKNWRFEIPLLKFDPAALAMLRPQADWLF